MIEGIDKETLLCLRLGTIVENSICERKSSTSKKRKRKQIITSINHDLSESSSSVSHEEGMLLSLFQTRNQMMKKEHSEINQESDSDDDGRSGLHLIHLLLISSTLVSKNNTSSAVENLCQLYKNVCLTGDSVRRVAAYFADGLVARMLTRHSPFYNVIMKGPTPDEQFFSFTHLYKVSPFYQFAHFTANQAILEAFDKKQECKALHVIDFDVSYGFQWPSLMQSLSEKAATLSDRILLRITGFGRNENEIRETETRLASFAKGFRGLVFEFHGLVRGSKMVKPKIKKGEVVATNFVFYLNSINSYSKMSDTLNYVRSISPSIVVLVEQEGSRKSTHSFLSRFMESLHYFAAIFDSLDDCLPLDSSERLRIEKNHLGTEIKHVMNCDKDTENCLKFESMETWKGRMERHGFSGVGQSLKSLMQAKLLLKMRSHSTFDGENGGFRVHERDDGRAISLGWQERLLITASSWCCV